MKTKLVACQKRYERKNNTKNKKKNNKSYRCATVWPITDNRM